MKTKLIVPALAFAIMTAATFEGASVARAATTDVELSKMIVQAPNLKDCGQHEVNTGDCHVHDENTYLHVRQNVPLSGHTHAWAEFRNWEQHFQKMHR